MSDEIQIDQEFEALVPSLTGEERSLLEASIQEHGCLDPLVVWRGEETPETGWCKDCGKEVELELGDGNVVCVHCEYGVAPWPRPPILLDGHNRLEICERLDIDYDVHEIELEDRLDAKIWIRENQGGRRNLSDDQRAINAAELAADLSERAKRERAKTAVDTREVKAGRKYEPILSDTSADKIGKKPKQDTRATAAKSAGVSERRVRSAAEVLKKDPELAAQVNSGKTTLKAAQKQIKKRERAEAIAAIPADLPAATDRYRIIHADLADVSDEVADDSLDWIITDPPYPKEHLHVYATLGEFAARTLKPGGSLICMVGQSYLPTILADLSQRLAYHWTLAYLTPGGQAVQQWERKVNTFWKPLLWLVKGEYGGEWIGDVTKSKVNDNDKRFHHWGQSESGMADIIERFTKAGDIICDPFVGGGATGVVAVDTGRQFVGIDIDADAIATTKDRLSRCGND